ncbi:uncharacterized protein [Excalfactoria chinensis]|uniref:uncharacterized protein n=1 Tax=Excalfactoria chinensis TaxID=46218 RepID=UPI003B3BC8A8
MRAERAGTRMWRCAVSPAAPRSVERTEPRSGVGGTAPEPPSRWGPEETRTRCRGAAFPRFRARDRAQQQLPGVAPRKADRWSVKPTNSHGLEEARLGVIQDAGLRVPAQRLGKPKLCLQGVFQPGSWACFVSTVSITGHRWITAIRTLQHSHDNNLKSQTSTGLHLEIPHQFKAELHTDMWCMDAGRQSGQLTCSCEVTA